jgi:hypothetical protein
MGFNTTATNNRRIKKIKLTEEQNIYEIVSVLSIQED